MIQLPFGAEYDDELYSGQEAKEGVGNVDTGETDSCRIIGEAESSTI